MKETLLDQVYKAFRKMYPDNASADRAMQEIRFAYTYSTQYNHGTDGHNRLNIIANLVRAINVTDGINNEYE